MKTAIVNLALVAQHTEASSAKPWRAAHRAKIAAKAKSSHAQEKILNAMKKEFEEENDPTTILQWWTSPSYLERTWMKKLPEQCGSCWVTNDRSMEKTANALLIDNTRYIQHFHKKNQDHPELENRNEDQYWVFWPREAASKGIGSGTRLMEGAWDAAFNLTTSYRRDSDIPRPFGDANSALQDARFLWAQETQKWTEREPFEEHVDKLMAQKSAPGNPYVAWMVSNCDHTRGAAVRWEFVQRLIKAGLNIEGFGECFDNVLIDSPWSKYSKQDTEWGFFAKYKFYFAFENSIHCNDYLSEKFWRNSLAQGLVPVVYGPHPDDVKAMAPPHSYIHVEDFDSPAALVDYLDYLDRNDTAYLEYHAWRGEEPDNSIPNASHSTERMYCGICKEVTKRKSLGFPKRMIKSVANWWWVNVHDDECTAGNEMAPWVKNMTTVTMENTYDELPEFLERKNKKSNNEESTKTINIDKPELATIEIDLGNDQKIITINQDVEETPKKRKKRSREDHKRHRREVLSQHKEKLQSRRRRR